MEEKEGRWVKSKNRESRTTEQGDRLGEGSENGDRRAEEQGTGEAQGGEGERPGGWASAAQGGGSLASFKGLELLGQRKGAESLGNGGFMRGLVLGCRDQCRRQPRSGSPLPQAKAGPRSTEPLPPASSLQGLDPCPRGPRSVTPSRPAFLPLPGHTLFPGPGPYSSSTRATPSGHALSGWAHPLPQRMGTPPSCVSIIKTAPVCYESVPPPA